MSVEPLDPELDRLLAAERSRGDAPADAKAAVRSAVASALGLGGASSPPDPSGALRRGWALTPRAIATVLGAFAAGAVGGGWLRGELPPRVVYVDRAVPSIQSANPAPPAVAEAPALVPASSAAPRGEAESAPHASGRRAATANVDAGATVARDGNLAAERILIDTSRSALARGDHAAALDAVAQHGERFPNGQLAEEREVIAVQALVAAKRVQEAADRAGRFRRKYPNSLLLPVLDAALR
jgi:hypothetical protein